MKSQISLASIFDLFDSSLDHLLIIDQAEDVLHLSPSLANLCGCNPQEHSRLSLADLLRPDDLAGFRSAMPRVAAGEKGILVHRTSDLSSSPQVFKTGFAVTAAGSLYLFRSSDGAAPLIRPEPGWDRVERSKELACLYSVGEWIQDSETIDIFFSELPRYLKQGMAHPDSVVVYSVFRGTEYGQQPSGEKISTELTVGNEVAGKIVLGYGNTDLDVLSEETKMLAEIGRFVSLALHRRTLAEAVEEEKREAGEFSRKLESRTLEVDEQRRQLDTVNAYLDQMNLGLQESKRRLETMFQAIPDTVALIDLNREIIMTNRDNMAAGELCHRALFDSDEPCQNCRLQRIIDDNTPITTEINFDDKYYSVHALPVFNDEHEVTGIIEFYRDITFKKSYEQQLQQADKLASLGQLVSGIGHEINNPNQFIRGNIRIIKQALEDLLPIADEYHASHSDLKIARLPYGFFRSHIMTLVNDMGNGSQRIKRIVDSLKSFARKDEGLLIDRVDINNVINESARLVHNQVHKYCDVILQLEPELPTFAGNAQKLEQVLLNLIINASQAMSRDIRGEIKVSTWVDADSVVISVEDNGSGMGEATTRNIFDPFFTTKRARGGTGLGLSIAYRIIEEHSGSIVVTSELGEGTTFTIRLPYQDTTPGKDKPSGEGAARTIAEQANA